MSRHFWMNYVVKTLVLWGIFTGILGQTNPVYSQQILLSQESGSSSETLRGAVELYNRGVDKLEAGDYQGAITDFSASIKSRAA
ncbi:MAG: hypothetical protein F6K10_02620 [Moorea sp. SIO2B7]|nr:hypothetical protein [Moorena sp. SIO2B7]